MAHHPPREHASKDLADVDVLYAVEQGNALDAFPGTPGKVIVAKIRKLETKGLVCRDSRNRYLLTFAGRAALEAQ